MTNTTFRKRALLSSVAMLLVALVALGSATFAWFSTTNKATAGTINAKTAKSSNILLSETGTGDWVSDLTFALNTSTDTKNLTPVTTKDFTNWYSVEAENYNQGYSGKSYESAIGNIKTTGTYVKYTQLFIQSVGETKTLQLNATATGTTGMDYLRVALVPITTDPAAANWGTAPIVFANGDNDRSNETAGWTAAGQEKSSIVTDTFGTAKTLGSATADTAYGYDVYVYYEGTDFDCKDMYSGTNMMVDFEITAVD